jgi:bifunctional DNA-binding transcriptional regulator/antitoxin component of YhaV-PrlF toxin-antitoxin module
MEGPFVTQHQTRMTKEGRVLIPAELRKSLGLNDREPLTIYAQDGEIRIVSRLQAIKQMQRRMAVHRVEGVSVVDELLRERREQAERESDPPARAVAPKKRAGP